MKVHHHMSGGDGIFNKHDEATMWSMSVAVMFRDLAQRIVRAMAWLREECHRLREQLQPEIDDERRGPPFGHG